MTPILELYMLETERSYGHGKKKDGPRAQTTDPREGQKPERPLPYSLSRLGSDHGRTIITPPQGGVGVVVY